SSCNRILPFAFSSRASHVLTGDSHSWLFWSCNSLRTRFPTRAGSPTLHNQMWVSSSSFIGAPQNHFPRLLGQRHLPQTRCCPPWIPPSWLPRRVTEEIHQLPA